MKQKIRKLEGVGKEETEEETQEHDRDISLKIYPADFRRLFKKWRESTTSSPSGRHIGHYKAILGDDDLVEFFCAMCELPLNFGFSPKRWETTCTLMLEKSAKFGPRLDKLRVIHLLEADYNFILKLIWGRRLIHKAMDNRLILAAQHARPGHIAQSTVLSKVIGYDLIRLAKLTAASMDNNAAGCYDKIVAAHGMLCCRRLGLPKSAAKMLTIILNNTVYFFRTGHGVSARSYCSNQIRRILGTGQGSGASPCIWTAILDTILWSLAQKHTCYRLQSPSGKIIDRVGDAYVDDTALMYVAQRLPDGTYEKEFAVSSAIETIAQDFERKLFSTGGELALHKCYWFLIAWKWDDDGRGRMATIAEVPARIMLTKGLGTEKTEITRLECTDAQRTIGINIDPSGGQTSQYNKCLAQTRDWAKKVTGSQMSRALAHRAYRNIYIPMIQYSFGATTLSEQQLWKIQSIAEAAFLPKAGMNRNFPRAVLRGPAKYGGANDPSFYTVKGYKQLQYLIGHIRNEDDIGTMLIQEIEFLQVISGISTQIMDRNTGTTWIQWTEPTWCSDVKKFLHSIGAGLHFTTIQTPEVQRINDTYIMDHIQEHITPADMELFNNCRLFLKAMTLADIVTPDGSSLDKNALCGRKNTAYRSIQTWPEQGNIRSNGWKKWSSWLKNTFCIPDSVQLRRPLGDWIRGAELNKWDLFQNPNTSQLYRRHTNGEN